MTMRSGPILVVGATGTLGSQVAKLLADSGHAVRAVVRPSSSQARRESLSTPNIELVSADLKDPASLLRACQGARAVVSTATSLLSSDPQLDTIDAVDGNGQRSLVDAAERQGVEQFVFLSFPVNSLDYALQSAKRAIENRLLSSSLLTTSVRATNFMEVWFSSVLGFDIRARRLRIFGEGTKPIQWISLVDVARFVVRELEHRPSSNRIVEVGGPDRLSYLDVAAIFEEVGGLTLARETVPHSALQEQFETASSPIAQAFAGVVLSTSGGVVLPSNAAESLPGRLKSVREYARQYLETERI